MRHLRRRTLMFSLLVLASAPAGIAAVARGAEAEPAIGQPAPPFSVKDADGKARSLAEFKGKVVVLEWTNDGCPYVRKHYETGAMQALQRDAARQGVVWLTVISSAPGKQGYLDPAGVKAWKASTGAAPAAVLLDAAGTMGRAYGARTTPHMFVVDKAGKLAYMGGADDRATPFGGDKAKAEAEIKQAKPYVRLALADVLAGRPVATPVTRPYGCSVKYQGS